MSTNMTRRAVLARTPAAIAAAGSVTLPAMASTPDDPVVPLWREYFRLETEAKALDRQYDAIWDKLPEEVRHPRIQYGTAYTEIVPCGAAPPAGEPLYVDDEEDIDKLHRPLPPDAGGPDAWHADLKRQLADAKLAARDIKDRAGLSQMGKKLDELTDRSCELMTAIEAAVATTPAGYAAKVLFHLANVDADDVVRDYPHCAQVSLLRDLLPHLPDDIARVANRFVSVGEFSSATIGETLFAADVA